MAGLCSNAEDGDAVFVSIPRGGPLFVPDMVGPIIRVPDFEASVYHELEDLKKELSTESFDISCDDILIDELKIITEEELVNKAFEEAFKSGEESGDPSFSEENLNERRKDESKTSSTEHPCLESTGDVANALVLYETSDGHPKQKNRKRSVKQKDNTLDESCIAKLKELARIKQKQDEDKAEARLHSFNGSCRMTENLAIRKGCGTNEGSTISSEKSGRMTSLKSMGSATQARASNAYEHIPVHYPEVVLFIEVYHNKRTWVQTQEFMVLGRQFLTELRDKIYCVTDGVMKKAGQYDPSGYMLVEDVFCNDLRDPCSIDYSKPILDWLEHSKSEALEKWEWIMSGALQQKQKAVLGGATAPQLPQFKSVYMQKTRFCDLKLRIGAGYLYCHQGDCKHVFVVRDVRMIHPEDVQNRAAYPLTTFQRKLRIQKCSVCKIYRADTVTIDDKWAAGNPCYFCEGCYFLLHYRLDGSLVYDEFSVFDHHQDFQHTKKDSHD